MFVCLSVCPFSKRVSGSSNTVENASNAPSSPEMEPALASLGSATVVLSQFSHNHPVYRAAILSRGVVTWSTIIAPFTCRSTNCLLLQ